MTQDAKKDEFKKYLEKSGVIEMLTKSLVQLYEEPEKPNDAVTYLKSQVGGGQKEKEEIEKLQVENKELKAKLEALEKGRQELEEKVKRLEGGAAAAAKTAEPETQPEAAPAEAEPEKPVEAPAEVTPEEVAPAAEAEVPKDAAPAEPEAMETEAAPAAPNKEDNNNDEAIAQESA